MAAVEEEDSAFRFLVRTVIENIPTMHGFEKEFPHVAAKDLSIVPVSVLENFVKASFLEHHLGNHWVLLWKDSYFDIVHSDRNYVLFVLYSCLTVNEGAEPFYERLLDIFGLVGAFAFVFKDFNYHVHAAPILLVLFETVLREEFYESGGWAGLDGYLRGLPYLGWYYLKNDLCYRDVMKAFLKEVKWRSHGKSYRREIRFVSAAEALPHPYSNSMADKVLAMDTSAFDGGQDLTFGCLMANSAVSRVRGALLQKRRETRREEGEYEEDPSAVAEDKRMMQEKIAKLEKQKNEERALVQEARQLFVGIEKHLNDSKSIAEFLKKLYYFKAN